MRRGCRQRHAPSRADKASRDYLRRPSWQAAKRVSSGWQCAHGQQCPPIPPMVRSRRTSEPNRDIAQKLRETGARAWRGGRARSSGPIPGRRYRWDRRGRPPTPTFDPRPREPRPWGSTLKARVGPRSRAAVRSCRRRGGSPAPQPRQGGLAVAGRAGSRPCRRLAGAATTRHRGGRGLASASPASATTRTTRPRALRTRRSLAIAVKRSGHRGVGPSEEGRLRRGWRASWCRLGA